MSGKFFMVYTRFMREKGWMSYVVILIVSLFLVADLFLHPGRSITFDGQVHITTIAQFYNALKDGEFPARWANGFATYGLPIPLVAHQTTSYLGAFFLFFTHNAVTAYNLVIFAGVFLSSAFFYKFLRYYFSSEITLVATLLFHFAPYRITNIYIRGAVPELFGTVFLPVVLIGLYQSIHLKLKTGYLWIILGTALLALTHPMMLVLSSVVVFPYGLYLLWSLPKNWKTIVNLLVSAILGIAIAGYYLLPLAVEIKYFAYGTTKDHFRPQGGFLKIPDFFVDGWTYFGNGHPGPRSNTLTVGSVETLILLAGIGMFIFSVYKRKFKSSDDRNMIPWVLSAVLCIFLMTTFSTPIYQHIFLFNNVQYPWRNLAPLMFVPPIILAWLLSKIDTRWIGILIVTLVILIRIPQSYGKNFMVYDLKQYDYLTANLHTNNMNTLWMGYSRDYPVRTQQVKIIEGVGTISNESIKNADRRFSVHSDQSIRLVDYTFYFPGWQVYVDGTPTLIQFQDPEFRGMITYQVPAGDHTIHVKFERTKIRVLGDGVTVIGILLTGVWMFLLHRYQKISTSAAVRK